MFSTCSNLVPHGILSEKDEKMIWIENGSKLGDGIGLHGDLYVVDRGDEWDHQVVPWLADFL